MQLMIFTRNKQNGKFAVVYEAGIAERLALITQDLWGADL